MKTSKPRPRKYLVVEPNGYHGFCDPDGNQWEPDEDTYEVVRAISPSRAKAIYCQMHSCWDYTSLRARRLWPRRKTQRRK